MYADPDPSAWRDLRDMTPDFYGSPVWLEANTGDQQHQMRERDAILLGRISPHGTFEFSFDGRARFVQLTHRWQPALPRP